MFVHEYEDRRDPTTLLFAPMMVSGSDLHALMQPHFEKLYPVIAPDPGGHGKSGAYIRADEEFRGLKAWLSENQVTQIELLYDASPGVALAYRLFFDADFDVI